MSRIHTNQRNPKLLLLSATLGITLAAYVNITPPLTIWHILACIACLSLAVGFFFQYLFCSLRRSILVAIGTTAYLLFRYAGMHNPVFLILILISMIAIDMGLRNSTKRIP